MLADDEIQQTLNLQDWKDFLLFFRGFYSHSNGKNHGNKS
jgi:hypothetical protein